MQHETKRGDVKGRRMSEAVSIGSAMISNKIYGPQ